MSKRHIIIEYLTTKDLKRLFRKIKVSETVFYKNVPCWEWTGAISHLGYGSFHWKGDMLPVHRFTYQWLIGGLIAGIDQEVDHLCKNRRCCNPVHLEAVAHRENTLRGTSFASINAAKTHCANGHPLDEANTFWQTEGNRRRRRCRLCYDKTQSAHRQRKMLKNAAYRAVTPVQIRRGQDHPHSVLNEESVRKIRALNQEGIGYIRLGRLFGVRASTIASIMQRRTWKHVA